MKTVAVVYTDEEFKIMKENKGVKNWHDFFVEKCT
jgi:hypothetical protein